MLPWRVKITQPPQKSLKILFPYFKESCQTRPVAWFGSSFEAEVKILKLMFFKLGFCQDFEAEVWFIDF